jgi:hypothetical protein
MHGGNHCVVTAMTLMCAVHEAFTGHMVAKPSVWQGGCMRHLHMNRSGNIIFASVVWVACRWPTTTPFCGSTHTLRAQTFCTRTRRAQLERRSRCTAILFAAMDVSSFAVIEEVRVAHMCMRALCQQPIHRHHTRSVSKHGPYGAHAGAPTCLRLASMEQCNRGGLLWRLSVGAVMSTRCTDMAGRC